VHIDLLKRHIDLTLGGKRGAFFAPRAKVIDGDPIPRPSSLTNVA
jgi:hypothetical protein